MTIIRLPQAGVKGSELDIRAQERGASDIKDFRQFISHAKVHYIMGLLFNALNMDNPKLQVMYIDKRDDIFVSFNEDLLPAIEEPVMQNLINYGNTFFARDMLHTIGRIHEVDLKSTLYSDWEHVVMSDFITFLLATIAVMDNSGFTSGENPRIIASSIDLLGFTPYAIERGMVQSYIDSEKEKSNE